jgi:SAM-dependent methyltransferase
MRSRQITEQLDRMRRDWDERAAENALYYVATGRADWSDEEFYRSGEVNVDQYVRSDLSNICQGKAPGEMKVLEIGCGAGRLTRALAGLFGEVHAVDISRKMVQRARKAVAGFPNVHIYQNNGKDLSVLDRPRWPLRARLEPGPFDFAFSYIVFQHIPSRSIIESYVRDVHRVLRRGGLFKFQVHGGALTSDAGESWVGASFNEREAREMSERCGFEMRYQDGKDSQYYWLWFFKP